MIIHLMVLLHMRLLIGGKTSWGGHGGLVVKSNDCKAKAMRDGQGSPTRQ